MSSAAQILANRSNAQRSTGPRTPEGKAAASRNAVKHGLLAEQVVIKGEDPAQFECYREGMLRELAPVGTVEEMLAERAVSLSWRLRRAERLQSAVFATVYRENADDIVLWPKHGLPIQPRPDEDEVILGQVVMTDFARAQVLDRLLVYERRIENSLYRTMGELRKEREARTAAAASDKTSCSETCPPAGQKPVAPAELGSFGADSMPAGGARAEEASSGCEARFVQRWRGGVSSGGGVDRATAARTTLVATDTSFATAAELGSFGASVAPGGQSGNHRQNADATKPHGQDARATETPDGVTASDEGRATPSPAETLHASPFTLHDRSCETKPIEESVKCEVSSLK